ncbi:prevent-host-death family protein [Skermanella aerolata]|uniref:type II toxin-antitoxin system Phd/YefM family antitoxin n=1 Tax=Skermanella aerolata TaxID=393310 RepID=UPI003D1A147C
MTSWSIQDAKTRFSMVVAAARHEPQTVTKHGKPTVVVIDAVEYERLKRLDHFTVPGFTDHLLAMPADDGGFEKLNGALRDPDL